MVHRLRVLLVALLFAAAGAVAGRLVGEMRRKQAAGLDPRIDLDDVDLRPRDVVPGLVAALRVTDRPWSFLHIPPWAAAFSVNFAVAAFGRELGPLVRMAVGDTDPDDRYEAYDSFESAAGGAGPSGPGGSAPDQASSEAGAPSGPRWTPTGSGPAIPTSDEPPPSRPGNGFSAFQP